MNETNIALTFVFQAVRLNCTLAFKYGVHLCWVMGVCVVLPLQIYTTAWDWDANRDLYQPCRHDQSVTKLILSSCACICLTSYVIVIGRSCIAWDPKSVTIRY